MFIIAHFRGLSTEFSKKNQSFSFWQFLRIMRAIAASAARGRVRVRLGARGRVLRAYQSSRDFGRWVLLAFLGVVFGWVFGWVFGLLLGGCLGVSLGVVLGWVLVVCGWV